MSLVKMISKLQHANEASGHVGMISISERATCFDQVDGLSHDQAWIILSSGSQIVNTKFPRGTFSMHRGTHVQLNMWVTVGTDGAARCLKLRLTGWNWNVKPIVHLSKFFYCLVSMLAKTINECENKSWVYNTEMPLALVSPHLCCLKHHVYFFSQPFRIEF